MLIQKLKNKFARDGDRTHAHIRELDLKSNALTTRPPWLIQNINIKMKFFYLISMHIYLLNSIHNTIIVILILALIFWIKRIKIVVV